ncbi:tetratricopeptide repeat protein [Streptomyces sp. NPDC051940]|uniref:tetratricopeptide repeat protein n=1 Tax=Streptomyces sp. NPDC051940 TaxID=3155675 RepID=UPI003432D451
MAGGSVPSRRELIRRWRQGAFVGRRGELAAFTATLGRPPEASAQFLFHIRGPAGVGKSTLVRQLESAARDAGAVTAYVDESAADAVEAMEQVSTQLARQGLELRDFDRRLDTYRQRRHEAAAVPVADPGPGAPAPSAGSMVASQLSLAGLGLIPGVGAVAGAMDPQQLAVGADRIKTALSARLRSHDDVQLVLSPLRVLTPVFLEGLAEHCRRRPWTVLFFDTYERTGPLLDVWLRDLLLDARYGEVPANVLVVLAGQRQLDAHCWGDWRDLITELPLEVFTEAESRQYLTAKGITDERVVEVVLRLSGRLPVLLSTLAEARPAAAEEVGDPSGTAVERFLKWETDPARRAAALAAALPQELDEDVFGSAVGEDGAGELFGWLRSMPFVDDRGGRMRYHDVVRTAMLRLRRRQSHESWRERHTALADMFRDRRLALEEGTPPRDGWWEDERWRSHRLQETYHRLCADPRGALPAALRELVDAADEGAAVLRRWVAALGRAGEDADAEVVRRWGALLGSALEEPEPTAAVLTRLLDRAALDEEGLPLALTVRGRALRHTDRPAESLADYTAALELRPDSVRALVGRGTTYRMMRLHEEALADFDAALRQEPERSNAHSGRGETLRMMNRYEESLASLDRAIALRPDWATPLGSRGATFRSLGRYEKSLADFDRAVELNPEYAWALANRGLTRRMMEHYDRALADFDQALELEPDYRWALAQRGVLLRMAGEAGRSLADFDEALRLEPDNGWALANRAVAYKELGRRAEALADLDRAVALDPEYAWAFAHRALLHQAMGEGERSLADLDRALEITPDSVWILFHRAHGRRLAGRYDEALADFRRVRELEPGHVQSLAGAGVVHRYAGRYEQALTALREAAAADPDSVWLHYELSVVLYALGHADRDAQVAHTLRLLGGALAQDRPDVSDLGNLFLVRCLTGGWQDADGALTGFLATGPGRDDTRELRVAMDTLRTVVPDAEPHLAAFRARLGAAHRD